jgi:two-component system chemotaxis response regulator CheB
VKHDFFAAGIGASAGGLPALKEFFKPIPANTGIAYIVVTHLRREHPTQLDELLRRYTPLPVCRLTSSTRLQPDHLYVLAENRMVTLNDGVLTIRERGENEVLNNAVDIFFTSLAADFEEKAIGIILSGCGSDGLKGSKAIKDNGGFVMVQSPESAQYESMPETIINQDHPVVKAPPAKLAAELIKRIN